MLKAQVNHFKMTCNICENEMEPESGFVLLEKESRQTHHAAYHRACLLRILGTGEEVDMIQGRDGVWVTKEEAVHQSTDTPSGGRANVPPRRKPGVSK